MHDIYAPCMPKSSSVRAVYVRLCYMRAKDIHAYNSTCLCTHRKTQKALTICRLLVCTLPIHCMHTFVCIHTKQVLPMMLLNSTELQHTKTCVYLFHFDRIFVIVHPKRLSCFCYRYMYTLSRHSFIFCVVILFLLYIFFFISF